MDIDHAMSGAPPSMTIYTEYIIRILGYEMYNLAPRHSIRGQDNYRQLHATGERL